MVEIQLLIFKESFLAHDKKEKQIQKKNKKHVGLDSSNYSSLALPILAWLREYNELWCGGMESRLCLPYEPCDKGHNSLEVHTIT